MVAKRSSRALALLLMLPSAAFALGFGDIRLLSPLNSPLDAQIELLDATPEELQTLQAQVASRDTFSRYGLDWPVFLSSVQVKTVRASDGKAYITLKSTDPITEPFITLLIEVNWARGHLVREYTMLLDPPVYTPGQSPASNTPVAAPAAGASAHEGAIARTGDTTPAPSSPGDVASATASGAGEASSPSADSSTATAPSARHKGGHSRTAKAAPSAAPSDEGANAGGSTHTVQRGETLSSIASTAASTAENSPEAHSWMLAIFQANPRAFEQNMNIMRTGAVLRMPESSTVAAISPSTAATEIRRQYAAWRGGEGSEGAAATTAKNGQLHLVTPSDDSVGPSAGAANSGEVKALQGKVHDLEGQLGESKRLLEMRNAELADLQTKLAGKNAPPPAAEPPPPPVAKTAPTPPPVEEAPPPKAEVPPPPAQTQPEETAPPAQANNEVAPPPAAEPPKPAEPTHKPKPAPVAQDQGGGLVDTLMSYWWALAALVALVAGYFGYKSWRERRQSEFDDSLSRLAVAGANSAERGFASGDTAPMRPAGDENPEGAFLVEESGTHQRPRFGAAPAPAAARHVSTSDETISSEAAINLDQGDPLAEADFHMAYGLYDQAADLIRIAINREPNRRDLKLKLLEVFFVWGNKEQFLQAARELAATREEAAPGEWEKIVIMGKQLAPDDPLFAGGGTMGATAGGVDLDLEGGQSRVDFDLLGESVPDAQNHGDNVDLDIGSALGEDEGSHALGSATDRNVALGGNYGHSGTTREMTARIPQESDDVMSQFGAETEGPTVEQPALASTDNPTIRQKVAMALKQTPAADQTAELAIDDLGLDLGSLDTMDQPGLGASSDAPTLVAGMDDRSRRIMEEAQRRAQSEETSLSTGAWALDENELDAALSEGNHEVEPDGSVTSRLSQLDGRDVDYDLGEAEHGHGTNGSGLDLDLGTATVPDAAFTATQKLSNDDLALPDLEPVTMSEVGTKLDLARAYMDMGDPDGAKNILEEVLHEGSMTQKQEAQRLMESLPG
jgi:pilus assembly protein FimV